MLTRLSHMLKDIRKCLGFLTQVRMKIGFRERQLSLLNYWKSRLGEKGVAWTRVAHLVSGILGCTEGFSPERELSRLSENYLA
ncbi:hypothetical protein Lal_00042486 [Lupinus albus]|nr:hypothetical protein Lal_00042486 [Lupinus albus]